MANNIDSMTNQYMQISGRTTQTQGPERTGDNPNKEVGGAKSTASQSVDTIQLTGEARLMQAVEQKLGSIPEVDSKRVEDVRSRIETGNYTVSAERTADKMLSMEQSMPGEK
ncbi:MAG: flagellar biosynthesis anti-sigma factor FlgM [Gammaproteobacteria bacterium]